MKKTFLITIILGCIMGFYQPVYSQDNIENGHEWVDLGLSVKWATCNVGANVPEQYGNHYAWGETKPKDEYSSENSVTYNQSISDFSGNPQYDAAAANWGGDWRMPTETEMIELVSKCTWEWIKQNGVRGYKVTGPNGNFIFLPASGYRSETSFTDGSCDNTNYWSSSPSARACSLLFDSGSHHMDNLTYRYYGCSVRAVREWKDGETPSVAVSVNSTDITAVVNTYVSSPISEITECGFYWGTNPNPTEADNNVVLENTTGSIAKVITNLTPNTTYYVKAYAANSSGTSYSEVVSFTILAESAFTDYVDLGLPSGLKWATYNVGASSPEEYGKYYAWGEVIPKTEYTQANSETYGVPLTDISGNPHYDAATANWGGDWRMPTSSEMQELIDNCTWVWLLQNGTMGYKVTGPNGSSIFLPAAGSRSGSSLDYAGVFGRYWSSSPNGSTNAYDLGFNSGGGSPAVGYYDRYFGYTVRPVRE